MHIEEFRDQFKQINKNERFFARPIFNNAFMSRLGELFNEKKFEKFNNYIINDDITKLRAFFNTHYLIDDNTINLKFYNEKVSMEFDIYLNSSIETDHPYYLGFYSDSIPLYQAIEILRIYFSDSSSKHWLTGIINPTDNTNNSINKSITITGQLMFAASPISEKTASLCIEPDTIDINDAYELAEDFFNHIDNYNNKRHSTDECLTEKDIPLSVKCICCYNVGQGNCIMLKGMNDEKIYFDVGLTRYNAEKNQAEIKNSIGELKRQIPDIIILSHWDTDHILGLSLWDDDVYEKKWIVPDILTLWFKSNNRKKDILQKDTLQKEDIQERKTKQVSLYAFRIFLKLIKCNSNNIYLISEKLENTRIYKNATSKMGIEIWTGQRKDSGSKSTHIINRANNFGLIMVIHGFYQRVILCGDCDYNIIGKELKDELKYDCVVVSHHGSKMGKFPFKPEGRVNSIAIVSYGICNTFGHPNGSKMTEISNSGYQIVTTVGRSKYTVPIQCKECILLHGV